MAQLRVDTIRNRLDVAKVKVTNTVRIIFQLNTYVNEVTVLKS